LSVGEGVFADVFAALRTRSEPEAGGVGGSARFGGGEGKGGVVSSLLFLPSGVAGLETVTKLDRLLRFTAVREIEADRGRGLYFVPSPRRISRAGFGGDFAFDKGTSSATSITGLSVIFGESGLPFVVAGDTGVYPVFSLRTSTLSSADGTGETGCVVFSVTCFQLAVLEADDEARVAKGAGFKSGIWICGRALRSRRVGSGGALTTASMVCVGYGRSRSLRCRIRSSRSLRDAGYSGWRTRPVCRVLVMGPVHSVMTEGTTTGSS